MFRATALSLTLCLALPACERGEAPSDRLKDSVGETIDDVVETAKEAGATGEPPRSDAQALLTRYTWPGADGEQAAKGEWAPKDECGTVKGADAFRTRLAEAVLARDIDAVVDMSDPQIKLDFGGGAGHATLRERLADPATHLWEELEELLALGCAKSGGGIVLPWHFAQESNEIDPFESLFVIGKDVPAYKSRDKGSEVLVRLSWRAVDLVEYDASEFFHIRLPDGREAFLAEDTGRSPVDYRMFAEPNAKGDWKINFFIAGD